jgi:hypothetical protein
MKNNGRMSLDTCVSGAIYPGAIASGSRVLELADLLGAGRQDWTLSDLVTVLSRRRRYLIVCVACMLLLATIYCLIATPRFQATGEIEVQKESPAAF